MAISIFPANEPYGGTYANEHAEQHPRVAGCPLDRKFYRVHSGEISTFAALASITEGYGALPHVYLQPRDMPLAMLHGTPSAPG